VLARYQIVRGRRPPSAPLPAGIRQDTRKHTRHCLRPPAAIVTAYLRDPTEQAWRRFAAAYRKELDRRFRADRAPFDDLAELASGTDVHLGCSCPTRANPEVRRCHTFLALEFMRGKYPRLRVVMPARARG
jgi:hypothetical protein